MRILPRIGIDDVRFGMLRDVVRDLLGEPEERAVNEEPDQSEAWYYWSREFSVHFDADVDWRLTTIEVDSCDAVLDGRQLIGMTVDQLRSAFPGTSLPWAGDEMEPIRVKAWSMNLWIEDGVIESVQWSVAIGEDDRECWPE